MGGVFRKVCVFFAACVVASLVVPPVATADPCTTILGCGDDLTEAMTLEQRITDNFWGGQVYEVDYANAAKTLGAVTHVGAFADSALWTGTYLGAQSFRYATAKKYLANPSLPADQVTFWTTQRDEAKARINTMVAKFHILINISKNWNHKFQLSLKQTGFGGGIIKGEPGYLMRACQKTTVPEWQRWSNAELGPDATGMPRPYTANRRVFGPLPWRNADGTVDKYWCEDGTSRDAYAGTMFGLLVAFDLVGGDDRPMRTAVRNDIVTLSNFAFKYLWNTPRPHGRISIPFDSNHNSDTCRQIDAILNICGHDFENFFSPLFIITPTAQMEMTQAAYHVTTVLPGHPDSTKWKGIYNAELALIGPQMTTSEVIDTEAPYDSYYKWNLEHLIMWNLIRESPNAASTALFKQAFAVVDKTTGNDINAHFEAITYGVTGQTSRRDAAVQHLRQWVDYRANTSNGQVINNQAACGHTIQCVPEDQSDMTLDGAPPITIPGSSTTLRAKDPLPVAKRTPTDFLWQRPPNQLNGQEGATHQAPGIDYLLPYWMLRYLTEVRTPALSPFPAWPGPSFD